MLKFLAASAAFFVIAVNSASACIGFDDETDTFSSSCASKHYIEYATVGGGCFTDTRGALTLEPGQKARAPKLSQSCGLDGSWWVQYGWCDYAKWKSGHCKPEF